MKFFKSFEEEKQEYQQFVDNVLANDGEEIKKVMVTKNVSLLDLLKKAVENGLEELCDKPLFPDKMDYRDMLVMLNNAANINLNFPRYIKRDIEYILTKLFPQYKHELNRLSNNDHLVFEKAIIYFTTTEKKLLNKYYENPCYEPSRYEYTVWLQKHLSKSKKE